MKRIKVFLLLVCIMAVSCIYPNNAMASEYNPDIRYAAHVENIGWQNYVSSYEEAGTTGQGLRMEAIKMRILDFEPSELGIAYRVYLQDIGWQNLVSNDQVAGTTGQSRRIEAIRIVLTGSRASEYDVKYQVHVENKGWILCEYWVSDFSFYKDVFENGETAGTMGKSLRLEAIRVWVTKK